MSEVAAGGPVTAEAGMAPGDAAVAAVRAFNRFYTNMIGLLRGKYLDTPYSLTEARILFELARRDASEATDLRQAVDIDTGYLSRILARFTSDGLISRQRSDADGRRQVIRLTDAGRGVITGLDARSAAEIRDMLVPVPDTDRQRLLDAMGTITDVLSGGPAARIPAAGTRAGRPGLGDPAQRRGVRRGVRLGRQLRGPGGPDRGGLRRAPRSRL